MTLAGSTMSRSRLQSTSAVPPPPRRAAQADDPRAAGTKAGQSLRASSGDLVLGGPDGIPPLEIRTTGSGSCSSTCATFSGLFDPRLLERTRYSRFREPARQLLTCRSESRCSDGVRASADLTSNTDRMFEQGSLHGKNVEESDRNLASSTRGSNALALSTASSGSRSGRVTASTPAKTKPAGPRRPERDAGLILRQRPQLRQTHNYRVTGLFTRSPERQPRGSIRQGRDVLVSVFALPGGQQSAKSS